VISLAATFCPNKQWLMHRWFRWWNCVVYLAQDELAIHSSLKSRPWHRGFKPWQLIGKSVDHMPSADSCNLDEAECVTLFTTLTVIVADWDDYLQACGREINSAEFSNDMECYVDFLQWLISLSIDTNCHCVHVYVLVYSCRLFQPDQHYLWCCVRILHWRNMSNNVWWSQVSEVFYLALEC